MSINFCGPSALFLFVLPLFSILQFGIDTKCVIEKLIFEHLFILISSQGHLQVFERLYVCKSTICPSCEQNKSYSYFGCSC